MTPQEDPPRDRPRTRLASYGVILGALAFSITVVVVMNRFHDRLDHSLEQVELQYEESLRWAKLQRQIMNFAQASAEMFARPGESVDREVHAQAARRLLSSFVAPSETVLQAETKEDEEEEEREAAEISDQFEAFVRRIDELARMDRGSPELKAGIATAFDDLLRQRLRSSIDRAIEGERKDVERDVAEYRESTTYGTWSVTAILVLIGLLMIPLYLRIDRGIRQLAEGARQIAAGDYTARVRVRGIFGSIADAFNGMARRVHDHQLAQLELAKELQASSAELLAVAKQTETNSADESSAVEETRHTMGALLAAATEIAASADRVASSAEHSARASEGIGEQILKLTAQSQKIRKITTAIRGIADKSDVLALNASLEGTKAGEAGRGFVLLGSEMRRLAESVSSAANEAGDLAFEIEELSKRAVLSTEMGQKLAGETLEVAKRINLITSQQRGATEQVTRSMEDVHQYTQQSLAAAKQTRATASNLVKASDELEKLVQASPGALRESA